jgi:hypothetical protein
MAKIKTSASEKSKAKTKRYATRYGHHYSIVMIPTVTEVINGIAVTRPGKTIEFKNGIYETTDMQEQEFLDNSPFTGIDYQEVTKEVTSALVTKSLAEREAELKSNEEKLKRREMEIQGKEEGAGLSAVDETATKEKSKKKQAKF